MQLGRHGRTQTLAVDAAGSGLGQAVLAEAQRQQVAGEHVEPGAPQLVRVAVRLQQVGDALGEEPFKQTRRPQCAEQLAGVAARRRIGGAQPVREAVRARQCSCYASGSAE